MTRAARGRHLRLWIVVAPAMLLVLVLALALRPARLIQEPPAGGMPAGAPP